MTPARLGALLALLALAFAGCAPGSAHAQPTNRSALIVLVPGATFEELLSVPDVVSLARAGGASLLVNADGITEFDGPVQRGVVRAVLELGDADELALLVDRHRPASTGDNELLVIVVGADLEGPADAIGGVIAAVGVPAELFPDDGEPGSLTSGSTRRDGVVAGVDVGATLADFLGGSPEDSAGEPIRVVEGPAPLELYDRYLAQRRMYVPVGTAGALYLTAVGLAGIGALAMRRSLPRRSQRAIGWAALSVAPLSTGMLAAGHLPELSYANALPFIALVTVLGTMAFSPLERDAPTLVPVGIGVAVLAYFVVEALTGWSGMLTPLLGGAQLDGGRFYGFPNVAIGLAVGAALWAVHRLPTVAGFAVLCVLGLFIGLPYVGSNLGGAVTAFAAAGLWVAIQERERLGPWKGAGVVTAVGLAGGAIILGAHAIAPIDTHISAFEEQVSGVGGVLETFVDRLGVGIDLIARAPASLIPVLGLPVLLVVVLRPPAPIRAAFDRWPSWRDAVLVTTLAGIVGYVVNDSGPAAAGLAFGLALGGTLGVSLLATPEKMAGR